RPQRSLIFRYSFSFFPAELGLERVASFSESDLVLGQALLVNFGAGLYRRLLEEEEESRRGSKLAACCRLGCRCVRFLLPRRGHGLRVRGGDDESLITPAELRDHVAVEPIAVTEIMALQAAGFA